MKNRVNFLSPNTKNIPKYSNKIILSPIQYNINGLCLRLKKCLKQKIKKKPVIFTFNLLDVIKGYMPDTNININDYVYDYRSFPLSKI